MRNTLLALSAVSALGLTACVYDPVADAERRPPAPVAVQTADGPADAVTATEPPADAPLPEETVAPAAQDNQATLPEYAIAEPPESAPQATTSDQPPANNATEDAQATAGDASTDDAPSASSQPVNAEHEGADAPLNDTVSAELPMAHDAVAKASADAGSEVEHTAVEPVETTANLTDAAENTRVATGETAAETHETLDEAPAAADTDAAALITEDAAPVPAAESDTAALPPLVAAESAEAANVDATESADAVVDTAAEINSNRTVAADGIEDIMVPVVPNATGAAPPNIIFLITDDQARDDFGFLGGRALTPHIDALRAGGTHLANHYVSSSVCSPSRYTCLTGQYASRNQAPRFLNAITDEGITHVMWNQGFVAGQPTLPSVLQSAGYATGFTGKWHLGFDVPGGFAKVPDGADASNPADPGLIATLNENQQRMSAYLQTLGFGWAKNIYGGNPDDSQQLKKAGLNLHHQEWLTQAALEFVEANQNGPFFLYYATTLTHSPEPVDSLETDPLLSPVGQLDEPITGLQPARDDVIRRVKEAGVPRALWGATWLDDGVGALVKKLEDLGIAENTLIVYFDDHGMEFRSKGTLYQGGLVSPTMAYWPGTIPAGGTVKAITQNTDFAPTFMALAGATPPAGMEIDGKDITDLLTGDETPVRDSVYAEIGLTRSVTTADGWKYLAFRVPPSLERTLDERLEEQKLHIATMHKQQPWTVGNPEWDATDPEARYSHLGMGAGGTFFERIVTRQKNLPFMPNYFDPDQLYNLTIDPNETTNLAGDANHAEKLAEMQEVLKGYLNDLPGTYMDLKPYDDNAMTK